MPLQFRNCNRHGPERELVDNSLKAGLPIKSKYGLTIFEEPALPIGYPDIVAVCPSRPFDDYSKRIPLKPSHLRVLHHLYTVRKGSPEDISQQLLVTELQAKKIVQDLLDAELLYSHGKSVAIRSLPKIFFVNKIISIEAKIQDWKTAILQAATNTWFASHSYILLPPKNNLDHICSEAARYGVGVMVFDDGPYIASEARPHQIPASYGSWLFNEQLVWSK